MNKNLFCVVLLAAAGFAFLLPTATAVPELCDDGQGVRLNESGGCVTGVQTCDYNGLPGYQVTGETYYKCMGVGDGTVCSQNGNIGISPRPDQCLAPSENPDDYVCAIVSVINHQQC